MITFLVGSVLMISGTFYAYQVLYTPNLLLGESDRSLVITDDMSFYDLQKKLLDEHYVGDLQSFSLVARLMGYDKHMKPGRYVLPHDIGNLAAVRYLRQGLQTPVQVTFNSARLLSDVGDKITRNIAMTPGQFDSAAMRFARSNEFGFDKESIRCMFIPNTYEVYYDVTPDELVQRMHTEYENFWSGERTAKADSIGLTPVEVSILASIVQAEVVKQSEAPLVAGLYINRLRKNMLLMADPTLVYANGNFETKRVLDKDKEIDSPYNTYKHRGLPPGPINIPEIASIDAVLNYTRSDYLYMCAREDFSGYHNFAKTFEEHERNAARYQHALSVEMRKAREQ